MVCSPLQQRANQESEIKEKIRIQKDTVWLTISERLDDDHVSSTLYVLPEY